MNIENFTAEQVSIYNRVRSLEERIRECNHPDFFVLNAEINELVEELDEVQSRCNHVFEDGFCVVCGRPE